MSDCNDRNHDGLDKLIGSTTQDHRLVPRWQPGDSTDGMGQDVAGIAFLIEEERRLRVSAQAEVARLRNWQEGEAAEFGMSREVVQALRAERDKALKAQRAAEEERWTALDQVRELRAKVERLRAAVRACRDRFTTQGALKAMENREMVDLCDAALGQKGATE